MTKTDQLAAGDRHEQARRLWKEANNAFRERDYERTVQMLKDLLDGYGEGAGAIDPCDVRVQLGITLLRLKRTEEGVAELLRAVKLDPYNGRARYKLGLGLARLGRRQEALESLQQSVKLAPNEAEHVWRLSEELRRHGRLEEAKERVRDALALKPDHAAALETRRKLKEDGALIKRLVRFAKS